MTKIEFINDILNRLRDDNLVTALDNNKPNGYEAIRELLGKGLIVKNNDIYELGKLGYDAIDTGLPYPECLKKRFIPNINIEHHGHNINAPISQSDFSKNTDNSLNIDSQNTNTPIQSNKKSIPDKVYWIATIVAAILTIWSILHQMHITINF